MIEGILSDGSELHFQTFDQRERLHKWNCSTVRLSGKTTFCDITVRH